MFFILSTFIPVSFLAYLSYSESNDMLLKKAHHQLDAAANSYNKVIYDRLLLAEQVLQDAALKLVQGADALDTDNQLIQRIRGLTLFQPGGGSKKLLGGIPAIESLNAAELGHLASGKTVLKTRLNGAESTILFLTALNQGMPEKGILIADPA